MRAMRAGETFLQHAADVLVHLVHVVEGVGATKDGVHRPLVDDLPQRRQWCTGIQTGGVLQSKRKTPELITFPKHMEGLCQNKKRSNKFECQMIFSVDLLLFVFIIICRFVICRSQT